MKSEDIIINRVYLMWWDGRRTRVRIMGYHSSGGFHAVHVATKEYIWIKTAGILINPVEWIED